MSGYITASDLGLKVSKSNEKTAFRWFLASYLFGKRISQDIARKTWEVFIDNNVDSPDKITKSSWQRLVDLLGEGHYKRYDESTARNLQDMSQFLIVNYDGKITNLLKQSGNADEAAKKLQELKGVGPKTSEIFLREIKI